MSTDQFIHPEVELCVSPTRNGLLERFVSFMLLASNSAGPESKGMLGQDLTGIERHCRNSGHQVPAVFLCVFAWNGRKDLFLALSADASGEALAEQYRKLWLPPGGQPKIMILDFDACMRELLTTGLRFERCSYVIPDTGAILNNRLNTIIGVLNPLTGVVKMRDTVSHEDTCITLGPVQDHDAARVLTEPESSWWCRWRAAILVPRRSFWQTVRHSVQHWLGQALMRASQWVSPQAR